MKKSNVRIDMTPMVDLGFLLITFFVMTARLAEPASLPLNVPADGPPISTGETATMTVLLNGDDVFYYHGDWEQALSGNAVVRSSLAGRTGLRQVIGERQAYLDQPGVEKLGRAGLMVIMKVGPETDYNTVVSLMDEMLISNVTRHALVKISSGELEFLSRKQ